MEIGTGDANIVVDQPLEAQLDSPTVLDRAISELGDSGLEKRADAMLAELEGLADQDPSAAAMLAYELGELYERRLADEARAVKAYNRALSLDPSLRPNLWAIHRVFYRRELWPNLAKLISAEVDYAQDDYERADLLLEKARVIGHLVSQDATTAADARSALDEAVKLAPGHQGALLELERVVAVADDRPALLDVWESLADAVEQPARKIAYHLEVGRAAGATEYPRAQTAFDRAAQIAQTLGDATLGERIARERLRIAEAHGTTEDTSAAIDALANLLLGSLGALGTGEVDPTSSTTRATAIRRELVALRRRQAQIVRAEAPDKAWETLQQALALAPGEPVVLADLTELAEELGRYEALAELVQSWQAVEGDPGRAMVLSIRRADALLRGGQRDQARALLASLEAQAPGFVVLTSAAERDAFGAIAGGSIEPYGELARTYLAAATASLLGTWLGPGQPSTPDAGAAAALFVQAADLFAHHVESATQEADARAALGKALEAMPDYSPAIEALVELDAEAGKIGDALARLRTIADATLDHEQKRAILDRATRLARAHGDLEAVLGFEQAVAALVPTELA
ncbi:MAG: hypothetical protein NT062_00100, partial [Proteobacteria bacterium]|nr:hypothetical protein [Pseudomonadota bacterium]